MCVWITKSYSTLCSKKQNKVVSLFWLHLHPNLMTTILFSNFHMKPPYAFLRKCGVSFIKLELLWLQTWTKSWIVSFYLHFSNQQNTKCQLRPLLGRNSLESYSWYELNRVTRKKCLHDSLFLPSTLHILQ